MESNLEHMWKVKEYVSQYIQFADTKAGLIIALSTLNIALLVLLPGEILTWEILLILLSLIPIAVSLFYAIQCIKPRTTSPSNNSIFWGNIAKYRNYDDYKKVVDQADKLEDLQKQVFEISKIAQEKYRCIERSVESQKYGLIIFWVIILIIRLF
ncbi:Pycsar system effector family protein [Crocosphaera sp.]|uniref:Pycsar system effector family protein n=1 Tax=Crocosphaera sp. TaxID=2729996 RepID=UPI00261CDC5C|nr:Pycsar system effector family protein [Crocosphaera sp.]MDJ0583289.1 DUF5706 domain-containing protein [Crocosphaera sp.]